MRVFRHRHTLGCVTLFAFAMQAMLALAHTHAHTAYTTALVRGDGLAARAITYGLCRAGAERPCPPPARHDDHAKCAICWSMSLAAAAVLGVPPPLPAPPAPTGMPSAVRAAHVCGGESVHFQARAPPLST